MIINIPAMPENRKLLEEFDIRPDVVTLLMGHNIEVQLAGNDLRVVHNDDSLDGWWLPKCFKAFEVK